MHWVFEAGVFEAAAGARMQRATAAAGHRLVPWDDAWLDDGLPHLEGPVVFRGSLAHADALRRGPWSPGAWCATEAFACSAWYPRATPWLAQRPHVVLPLDVLVADPGAAFDRVGAGASAFLRPDSPLKPFAGRVLARDAVRFDTLDYGFYYDDPRLPVVVAPVRTIGAEWRFVVVDRRVVAGSGYDPSRRAAAALTDDEEPWRFAQAIAAQLEPPEVVYTLDVCATPDGLRLLELNPFSGADLYACDLDEVVRAVGRLLEARG